MKKRRSIELSPQQRKRTVWRLDGEAGSDELLIWLLARDYHIMAKGMSNRRAETLARQVQRWDPYAEHVWLGEWLPRSIMGAPYVFL